MHLDRSTKWNFTQLTGFNGFAVAHFTTRKEIRRVANPPLPLGLNHYLCWYSRPNFKLVGSAELGGKGAGRVTLTPDGKTAW